MAICQKFTAIKAPSRWCQQVNLWWLTDLGDGQSLALLVRSSEPNPGAAAEFVPQPCSQARKRGTRSPELGTCTPEQASEARACKAAGSPPGNQHFHLQPPALARRGLPRDAPSTPHAPSVGAFENHAHQEKTRAF